VVRYGLAEIFLYKTSTHSGNIQETFRELQPFREHLGNIQGTFRELQPFREHSRNIQGTFREHSGNIQGTFREHSGNIQGKQLLPCGLVPLLGFIIVGFRV
jgi:hypothetical protein